MSPMYLNSQERLDGQWQHVGAQSAMPERMTANDSVRVPFEEATSTAQQHTWWRAGLSFVRNAAIGLALIIAAPLAVITARGDALLYDYPQTQQRIHEVEPLRTFPAPVNRDVSVQQAGEALRVLQARRTTAAFPEQPLSVALERSWKPAPDGNAAPPRTVRARLPNAKQVISRAHAGLSANELAELRAIAESPVFIALDQVASAERVDFIGSQFVVPFANNAWAPLMPIASFYDGKALAQASVARAAYHVALSDYESAELALRSLVSYGFLQIDHGVNSFDAMLGRVMVGMAHDGLTQLRAVQVAVNAEHVLPLVPVSTATQPGALNVSRAPNEVRARLLQTAADPNAPSSIRYESLYRLAFSSCGTVRGALYGPPADVRAAFADARTTLAQFPSEQAYLDLMYRSPANAPDDKALAMSLSARMLIGAATVASTALQNPRLLSCTRLVNPF